ncbi:MAG: peptidase U32 family protein, partial [Polyangiales bacterium]
MPSDSPSRQQAPEILAPAGSQESFAAALASGADAVYLGLSEGFQARARSTAFDLAGLPALVARAHAAGVKVYLTLNTLVFESELPRLEALLRQVIVADVDALIVQDPAVALIARELCPALPLHASTQMTISSVEGARFAATLGICRVVLPRELSVREIARFTQASPLEAEVFVHGALCMAWSGQCLTSEAFSQRSANRGQCSQACRMPYDLVVDGEKRDLGDTRYLLSPQDLAAAELLPELAAAGVRSLKIEGRYKNGAYVIAAVDALRQQRDALQSDAADSGRLVRASLRTRLTFSRGASLGFLGGDDHQTLVQGRTPKHRGIRLGRVLEVRPKQVRIALGAPVAQKPPPHKLLATISRPNARALGAEDALDHAGRESAADAARARATRSEPGLAELRELVRAGMGVMFDVGDPERDDAPGGPIFSVRWDASGELVLGFGQPGPALSRVSPGSDVYLTGDPEWQREAERRAGSVELPPRIAVQIDVSGAVGAPLVAQANAEF